MLSLTTEAANRQQRRNPGCKIGLCSPNDTTAAETMERVRPRERASRAPSRCLCCVPLPPHCACVSVTTALRIPSAGRSHSRAQTEAVPRCPAAHRPRSPHLHSLRIRPRGHDGDAGLRRQPVVVATGRRNRSGVPVPVLLHGRQQRVVRLPGRLHVRPRAGRHSHVRLQDESELYCLGSVSEYFMVCFLLEP